jgi:PD-(D/E)XK nuclease superfamily
MARPTDGYRTKSGERVPGVTTICGKLKNADALMAWAWREGKAGRDYKVTRDQAADAGSLAHRAVEAWIRKEEYILAGDPMIVKRAQTALKAFHLWREQSHLRIIEPEISLVSEVHRFGGTMDAILLDDRRAIADWKSSAALYPDMLVQIAAYGYLWNEHYADDPITGGFHLIRFDKEYGDFHHHFWGELDAAWETFVALRRVYELEQELRKRAR